MTSRILDLFAGAGLVADGLIAAGLEPWGVDIKISPRYPAPIIRHDALTLDERFLDAFPFIWASPPCLEATELSASARREQAAHGGEVTAHVDLIPPTRAMLQRWAARTGGLYVIENVRRAKLLDPVILDGFMFELGVTVNGTRYHLQRQRKFEVNWPLVPPWSEPGKREPIIGVYGGHARCRSAKHGGRATADFAGVADKTALMREAMGVTRYLTGQEVSQGIPPAFAAYVAEQMIEHKEMTK